MNFDFGEVQTFVSDLQRAKHFYAGVLGLNLQKENENWLIFEISGIEFVVMSGASSRPLSKYGKDCETVLCLKSKNIEEDIGILKSRNVSIVVDVQTVPQGKYAVVTDPDGNHIEIIQH